MEIERLLDAWKSKPEYKDSIIVFIWNQLFCKVYGKDAEILSRLFNFKVNIQWNLKYVGFPLKALKKYLNLLRQSWFSYIVVQYKEGKRFNINSFQWYKTLDISVPLSTFSSFLDELSKLIEKYKMSWSINVPLNPNIEMIQESDFSIDSELFDFPEDKIQKEEKIKIQEPPQNTIQDPIPTPEPIRNNDWIIWASNEMPIF